MKMRGGPGHFDKGPKSFFLGKIYLLNFFFWARGGGFGPP